MPAGGAAAGLRRRPRVRPPAAPRAARPNDRVDFTETLFWNAGARTDAQTGEATVRFALNDSVTVVRRSPAASTTTGALGAAVADDRVGPAVLRRAEAAAGGDRRATRIRLPVSAGQRHRRSRCAAAAVKATARRGLHARRRCRALDLAPRRARPAACIEIGVGQARRRSTLTLDGQRPAATPTRSRASWRSSPSASRSELAYGGLHRHGRRRSPTRVDDPRGRGARQPHDQRRGLPHAAGQHDPGAGAR